ncbi:hypothetical protein K2173_001566 [Erythroxylum novogranatense]|uniref:Gnk2-homologous domain-containing protein n=1 Tax=Erythroxylum novogranatense TaxID=1862640 RepID=A0AAV8T5A8_9ROSI|nr:hypothetical protein K2173_001566 [Erythroxylum novogranatense]
MTKFLLDRIEFLLSFFMLLSRTCFADSNEVVGLQCSASNNAITNSEYQSNLQNLLSSLAENAGPSNGFSKATSGKGDSKIYGLTQCRGDVLSMNCINCIRNSTAVHDCSSSENVTVWQKWCLVRYANVSFAGTLDRSAMATANETDYDDPDLVSKRLDFMQQLASTTPDQPFMFQTAELDAGQNRTRYGMAQCTRDISRNDCGKCLEDELVTFRTTIGNKKGWEIYGSSCSMWYHDFRFYFNYSIPRNEGSTRLSLHKVATGVMVALLMFLTHS